MPEQLRDSELTEAFGHSTFVPTTYALRSDAEYGVRGLAALGLAFEAACRDLDIDPGDSLDQIIEAGERAGVLVE